MKNIFERISNNSLLVNTAKLASSNILLFLIPLIVTPILSRIYAPEFFGEWGVFSCSYSIIGVVVLLCYEYAIIKATKQELANTIALTITIGVCVTIIIAIIYFLGRLFEFQYFLEFNHLSFFLFFIFLNAILLIQTNLANRNKQYWVMSIGSLLQGLSQAFFRIVFGLVAIFSNGLIGGTVVASVIVVAFYLFNSQRLFSKDTIRSISLKNMYLVAVKYKKFPLYEAPATLLLFATFNLTVIILSLYFNKAEIGCISIVQQLILLPISFVGSAMGKVYYQQISEEGLSSDTERSISRKMAISTLLISTLPAFFLIFGGDNIIVYMLGQKWGTAGNLSLCLVIWSIPTILTQPLLPIYRKYNKQNRMFTFNIINFVLGVGSMLLSCECGLELSYCVFFYAISSSLVKFAMYIDLLRIGEVDINNLKFYILFGVVLFCIVLLMIRLTFIL